MSDFPAFFCLSALLLIADSPENKVRGSCAPLYPALYERLIRIELSLRSEAADVIIVVPAETRRLRTYGECTELLCALFPVAECRNKGKPAERRICFQIPFPQEHGQSQVPALLCRIDHNIVRGLKDHGKILLLRRPVFLGTYRQKFLESARLRTHFDKDRSGDLNSRRGILNSRAVSHELLLHLICLFSDHSQGKGNSVDLSHSERVLAEPDNSRMIPENQSIHTGGIPPQTGDEKRHTVQKPERYHLIRVTQINGNIKITHLCAHTVDNRRAVLPVAAHIKTQTVGKKIKKTVPVRICT